MHRRREAVKDGDALIALTPVANYSAAVCAAFLALVIRSDFRGRRTVTDKSRDPATSSKFPSLATESTFVVHGLVIRGDFRGLSTVTDESRDPTTSSKLPSLAAESTFVLLWAEVDRRANVEIAETIPEELHNPRDKSVDHGLADGLDNSVSIAQSLNGHPDRLSSHTAGLHLALDEIHNSAALRAPIDVLFLGWEGGSWTSQRRTPPLAAPRILSFIR